MTGFPARPAVQPPRPWSFPRPLRARLDNGLDLLAYHLPGQHLVAAQVVLDLPLTAEQRELEGVATLCARTLDEGTAGHPGESFADALETEGAGFGIDVSLSGLQAILDVPATRLERALELFAEAVTTPQLDAADVDRQRTLRLAEIEQAQANSAQAASIAFRQAVFSAESRASRMSGGEPSTVAGVTAEAVRRFHAERFGPSGGTLVLAGDFGSVDAVALAQRSFGAWTNPGQLRAVHEQPSPTQARAVVLDRPGSVQADLRLGGFGIDRTDPRWADITVASYAMGGAFLSRLNAVLREERGFTYGVRMSFMPLRHGGSYAVQGSFRTDVLAAAVVEARSLLDTASRPFTAAEVDDAVAYYVGVSPLRYATADGVADQAATQVLAGLPDDYVDVSLAALRAVTPESATAAYQELVAVEEMSLVVVGSAEALAEPLRAAGFADLRVVESA